MTKAILCSDLHLSHKPPVSRSAEPDWYSAQARTLVELSTLADELDAPILMAGDVFDNWRAPNELVNWALSHMPEVIYAIPGQHDLPHHNQSEIRKSAYWTLVKAGAIIELGAEHTMIHTKRLAVYGMPWGAEFPEVDQWVYSNILVAHRYVWHKTAKFPTAPAEASAGLLGRHLKDFDVALFGDNHIGFQLKNRSGCLIWNNGAMTCRTSDQRDYRPRVGLLQEDDTVKPHYFSTGKDAWVEEEVVETKVDDGKLAAFLDELQGLESDSLDFRKAVEEYLTENEPAKAVAQILVEAIGG